MMASPPPPAHGTRYHRPGVGIESLDPALEREAMLLAELLQVLRQQREAVATENLFGVEDAIFSAQRILRTLAETRIKRRTLLEILGVDPDIPLEELEEALGPKFTSELNKAVQTLRTVSLKLTGELEVNRQVLNNATWPGETVAEILSVNGDQDTE